MLLELDTSGTVPCHTQTMSQSILSEERYLFDLTSPLWLPRKDQAFVVLQRSHVDTG